MPESKVPAPEPSDAALSGTQVIAGRYELLGLLGTGGMGTVYRALDRDLDEIVALKMLRPELVADEDVLARFRREAKLARRVTHHNVARTFDIGEHEGAKFLTMEFIDGESLGAVIEREGALNLLRVMSLVESICAGLSAAHAAGVVHRDLKPDNVLIAKDGRIVITDFGIARALDVGGGATRTLGMIVGTPAYMSPEQVEGQADIDARTDIYALGAMLYELFVGEAAWPGDSVLAVAAARLISPPPNPQEKRNDLPDAAARVVLKCMARKREDRFVSVEEVVSAMTNVTLPASAVVGKPVPVRAQSNLPPPNRTPSSRPHPAGASGHEAKVVGVLPFRNGGAPEDEYLADGLTDDLIDTLSMTPGLKVRSRGAVMRLKGAGRDPRDLGRELDVQVVVDGSVRREGNQLRISARLISVADGFQLWAKRFERRAEDVLMVGDEAATAIADALTVERKVVQHPPPSDPLTLDLYLRARHASRRAWFQPGESASKLFEEALARSPDDPMILAGYAMALVRLANFETTTTVIPRAKAAAERALAIAPNAVEAHLALANVLISEGQSVEGARAVRHALRLSPNHSDTQVLAGRLMMEVGLVDEGIARLQSAMALDPSHGFVVWEIARVQALMGDWAKSDEAFERQPDLSAPLTNIYWNTSVRLLMWRPEPARIARLRALLAATPNAELRSAAEGQLRVVETRDLDAHVKAYFEGWLERTGVTARRRSFALQLKAEVLAYVGRRSEAIAALEAAAANALVDILWLDRCPVFADLRGDPAFAAVREKVAATAALVIEAFA